MKLRNAVFAATLFLLFNTIAAAQSPARPENDSFRDSEGKDIRVRVALDRIGIVFRSSAIKRADAVGKLYSLTTTREGQSPLFVYSMPTTTRARILELADKIRREQREVVEQAGLVVTQPPSKVPNVATNEFIVQYDPRAEREALEQLKSAERVVVLMPNPFVKGQYLLAAPPGTDVFALTRALRGRQGVRYAFPNFISVDTPLETVPAEPLFGNQWHLRNTGASGGTATADSRATFAWDITEGAPTTVIGIYELGGFEIGHEDLAANVRTNAAEAGGAAGVDDDGNGEIDDVNGWSFVPCAAMPAAGCGTPTVTPLADDNPNAHPTSVSGIAAARINGLGGSGACPLCTFHPTFRSAAQGDFVKALPYGYLQASNTPIVNNSWGGGGLVPSTMAAINTAATAGRGGLGMLIFFAAGNNPIDPCAAANPYVSNPNVIAINGSSNSDRKVTGYAFGNCIGLLAPTSFSPLDPVQTGTLATTTTDRTGNAGYNVNVGCFSGAIVEPADTKYTNCFGGTSSATPLVSGIAGLMLTTNSGLSRVQVLNALQDTADKIEDSSGAYATASGFSSPAGAATHGFGRVNAFEAVRLVTPVAQGGRGSVDVFLRDNRLDWGNTDQPSNTLYEPVRGYIPHWQSVDIKVDAPPYQAAPTNNAQFEAFTDEQAEENVINKVYVRVRNRGPVTATGVSVKLHWAFAGAGLPSLPANFWTNFPADTPSTIWNSLGTQSVGSLAYSGASVANTGGDAAAITTFNFTAPLVDLSQPDPHHFCLFAIVDSTEDRPGPKRRPEVPADSIPDSITPTDNNVTHRNIYLAGDGVADLSDSIYIANPSDREDAVAILRIDAPRGWKLETSPYKIGERFPLKRGQRIPLKVKITAPSKTARADVTVMQETYVGKEKITGGMTYRFGKPRKEKALQHTTPNIK
jgi:hypothetical protein